MRRILHYTSVHATRSAAVHIELFGRPIGGAPFACTVLPAATCAAKSAVTGLLPHIRAGTPMQVALATCDRFGNPRWGGGDSVRVLLLRSADGDTDGALAELASQQGGPESTDLSTAASDVSDSAAANRDDSQAGRPSKPAARTTMGVPEAAMTRASSAATSAAGRAGGKTAQPAREPSERARRAPSTPRQLSSRATGDGACLSTRSLAGKGGGRAVPMAAAASAAESEELTDASHCAPSRTSEAHAAEACSSAELASAVVSFEHLQMRGASSRGCDVVDHGDGTYALTLLVSEAGTYTAHLFVDDRPANAPWRFTVAAGVPDPTTSELAVGATRGVIGRWVPLHVLARDAYGNVCDAPSAGESAAAGLGGVGGTDDGGIEVHVIGGEGRAMPVLPVGDGRFEGAVVSPIACLFKVAVMIGGVDLQGSPFELQVRACAHASTLCPDLPHQTRLPGHLQACRTYVCAVRCDLNSCLHLCCPTSCSNA